MGGDRSYRWYALLCAVAVSTGWLASVLIPRESDTRIASGSSGRIDYYSRGVKRTTLDENGHPRQLLLATELYHYTDDDHTELRQPVLTLYGKQDGIPWVIRAETAVLPADGEVIYLDGKVHISRATDKNGRKLDILTRNVRVKPREDYAETSEFTQMLSPRDTLSGKGAEVHFGEDIKIKLLSEVRRKHDTK